jgi:phosphoenolpyruvate-protein phosphotransferase (PTS system enzyme I)
MNAPDTGEIRLTGIGGSPGICIGRAYLVDRDGVAVIEKYYIHPDNICHEINRFKNAVSNAKKELTAIIAELPEDLKKHAYILETHLLMHNDKMLYGKAMDGIKIHHFNAEWALREATSEAKDMFSSITDSYLKGRGADIEHVSDRIMRNLVGAKDVDLSGIDRRVILVANNLSPAETSQIQLEKIMGFVTDRGGKDSHTSIIARTLEIPAVLALETATATIKNNDILIVDGTEGLVIINPDDETLITYETRAATYKARKADALRTSDRPAKSLDGKLFRVMGNIELAEEIVAVKDRGGDGIGLFRTEFLYMNRPDFPGEQELFEKYREVAELMAPHPVTIRTLDTNGDKSLGTGPPDEEANPALGLRAIRFCLKHKDIFRTQLRAILRAAAYGNVRLLIPMISSCEEIEQTRIMIAEAARSLEKDGLEYNGEVEFGIMVEVPSAVVMADAMAAMVDFFSIGTNDLVQYLLAIDRGNRHVAYLYSALHPAVVRLIKHLADVGQKAGINTYMCGEMASDIRHLPILMGIGISELSMSPQSIPLVKNVIRKISVAESREFLKEVLKQTTTGDILQLIEDTYGGFLSEALHAPPAPEPHPKERT